MRTAAAESLPFLLECARIRGPEYLTQMWQFVCPELLKAVDSEPEQDVKAEHMYAVAQVLWQALYSKCSLVHCSREMYTISRSLWCRLLLIM